MNRAPGFCAALTLLFLAACNPGPPRVPAIGEAYVGPATLSIRQDISLQSPVVATVSHGERLEILQRRRRLVRVRTPHQAEGWTDERLLLSPAEVLSLSRLSEQMKSAPSQGVATTYEALNVHTTPDAHSPSFLQVKEGEKVQVIGHRVAPRLAPAPPKAAPAPKPQNKKLSKKKSKEIPPPPRPSPPKLPGDWRELSQLASDPAPAPRAPQPVPMDDWSLIRNAAGETGWVLTRRLTMAIPDEVAQYAEGRRITSYLPLGETHDGTVVKTTWLWTTIESGRQPRDFDSFRVFVWSLRRHRYETAHIERNLSGFFPVLTHPVAAPRVRSAKDPPASGAGKVPGFSIVVEKQDGVRYRRNYAFVENRVRLSGEERVDAESAPSAPEDLASTTEPGRPDGASPADETWSARLKRRLDAWRQDLLGH